MRHSKPPTRTPREALSAAVDWSCQCLPRCRPRRTSTVRLNHRLEDDPPGFSSLHVIRCAPTDPCELVVRPTLDLAKSNKGDPVCFKENSVPKTGQAV
jgi:hypothetical protein